MADDDDLDRMTFRQVTPETWPDMVRLFESPGAPSYCWCMVWRQTPEEARHHDSASRKEAMGGRVAEGVPVGILGYLDGAPVAWCSVAPRSTYRRLVTPAGPDEGIWSIVCFFVLRRLRGQGTVRRLLHAAVEHARAHGATVVEAYPVDTDSHSYRFMGFVPVFQDAGFVEIGRRGIRRHVMRLELT